MEDPEICFSAQTESLRRRLDEAGVPWGDLSSRHETAGTVAHYERTRVATPAGAAMASWGYSALGPARGARVYASTLGYPDALEFWMLGEGSGPFALAPDEAAETISRLTADMLRGREQEQEQGTGKGMAVSINRVVLTGNLTRDPELRATAGGALVLSFGLAVNERRRNRRTGEWEDAPSFVDCVMFGSRAEAVHRLLSRGSKVAVEGRLRWSQWERGGERRSKLEVAVDDIDVARPRPAEPPEPTDLEGRYDDELPF